MSVVVSLRIPFTTAEISFLVELVNARKEVLECKKNDVTTICRKSKEWVVLTDEYNSSSLVTKRTTEQLKKQWDNIKATGKRKVADERRARRKTGGGLVESMATVVDELVINAVPSQMTSCSNPYDDDGEFHGDVQAFTQNEITPEDSLNSNSSDRSITGVLGTPGTRTIIPEEYIVRLPKKGRVTSAQSRILTCAEEESKVKVQLLQVQLALESEKRKYTQIEHEVKVAVLKAELEYWESGNVKKL